MDTNNYEENTIVNSSSEDTIVEKRPKHSSNIYE